MTRVIAIGHTSALYLYMEQGTRRKKSFLALLTRRKCCFLCEVGGGDADFGVFYDPGDGEECWQNDKRGEPIQRLSEGIFLL